ncbi:hypothetical protein [Pseudoduganella sp. R-43]|uniref:hypothetical protein n=1 Tax=Pseudoduganella sp. R-43 TaxID=3404063 RepID=UPI003CEBB5E1
MPYGWVRVTICTPVPAATFTISQQDRREKTVLSDSEIDQAKRTTKYSLASPNHEHHDCIRIAYQWLDAQKKIKGATTKTMPLKHIIEKWGGRYVSESDVEVAAALHPEIRGTYPYFNISARLTEPSKARLSSVSEAFKHVHHERHDPKIYSVHED